MIKYNISVVIVSYILPLIEIIINVYDRWGELSYLVFPKEFGDTS
jgi:hypothetical protein